LILQCFDKSWDVFLLDRLYFSSSIDFGIEHRKTSAGNQSLQLGQSGSGRRANLSQSLSGHYRRLFIVVLFSMHRRCDRNIF